MNQDGSRTLYSGKRGILPGRKRLHLRLAAAMSSSESTSQTTGERARRERRRSNTLLLGLGRWIPCFWRRGGRTRIMRCGRTLSGLRSDRREATIDKVIQAMAEAFGGESRTVRLLSITTDGAVEALALLGAGKADLAVGRGDLEMPADAQTVAIVRKNFVVLWAPSGLAGKSSKKKARAENQGDRRSRRAQGRRDRPDAGERRAATGHPERLRRGGGQGRGDALWHGPNRGAGARSRRSMRSWRSVRSTAKSPPMPSPRTARVRGEPKFLAIEASEAIALKHPRYESEEIPPSVFNANPAWPG